MIAALMLYTIAVTLLLTVAALGADHVARSLRWPSRVVWGLAMVSAVALSSRAAFQPIRFEGNAPRVDEKTTAPDMDVPSVKPVARSSTADQQPFVAALRNAQSHVGSALSPSDTRLDVRRFGRWDRPLTVLWAATTLLAMAWLGGSIRRVARLERRLTDTTLDGHPVLVSDDVGPALVGILRTQIVIPRWVLALPRADRAIILEHERQHARAFDPALVHAAAIAVALMPWNVPLWVLFARLRLAIEADCDRRVLGERGNARDYGRLLIAICERPSAALAPRVAFVERSSDLEHRIRRLTMRPRFFAKAAMASALGCVVLVTTAWKIPAPARSLPPTSGIDAGSRVAALVTAEQQAPLFRPCPKRPVLTWDSFGRIENARRNRTELPHEGGTLPRACSIHGDVLVVRIDSARVIVSARDTSDTQFDVTETYVFSVRAGSVLPDVNRYATNGYATFTDSVLYIGSPGQATLAFRFYRGATVQEPGAVVLDLKNSMGTVRSSFLTWKVLPQLRDAPRCPPLHLTDGSVPACFVIAGERVHFPLP